MQHGDEMVAKFSGRDINARKYGAGTPLRYVAAIGRSGWEVIAPARPAAPVSQDNGAYRKCRCCGRIAIHTTTPAIGCDDCV